MKARGKIAGVIIIVALCVTGGLSFMFWQQGPGNFVAKAGFYFNQHPAGTDFVASYPTIFSISNPAGSFTAGNGTGQINGTVTVYCQFPRKGNMSSSLEVTWLARPAYSGRIALNAQGSQAMFLVDASGGKITILNYPGPSVQLASGLSNGERVALVARFVNSTHAVISISSNAGTVQATVKLYNEILPAYLPASTLIFYSWGSASYATWRLVSIRTSWNANFPVI